MMELRDMVHQLRKELPNGGIHTYHQCDCDRGQCRSVKCWRCWQSDIAKAVGVIHSTWLVRKIKESRDIENDIQHFVLSQTEGGK